MEAPASPNDGDHQDLLNRSPESSEQRRSAVNHEDHDDSPMRKKPRLHNSRSDKASASRSLDSLESAQDLSETSQHVEQRTTDSPKPSPKTPSKITLNLRPTHHNSTPAQRTEPSTAMNIDGRADTPASLDQDAESCATIEAHPESPSSIHSPPVVEIQLDDPEDGEDQDAFIRRVHDEAEEQTIISEFPGTASHTPKGVLEELTAMIEKDSASIESRWFLMIGEWMRRWLQHTADKRERWRHMYESDTEFWLRFAYLVLEIVSRKTTFGRGTDKSRHRTLIVSTFFRGYLQICGHVLYIDAADIGVAKNGFSEMSSMIRLHHLQILERLFSRCEDSYMWNVLYHKSGVDVDDTASELASDFIDMRGSPVDSLMRLISHWSQGPEMMTTEAGCALHGFTALRGVAVHGFGENKLCSFAPKILDLALSLEQALLSSLNKPDAQMSTDFARCLIFQLVGAIRSALSVGGEGLVDRARSRIDLPVDIESKRVNEVLCSDLVFRVSSQFIRRGRMDLRMLGIQFLHHHLNELWRSRTVPHDPVVFYTMRLIEKGMLLEYLVSVISHPQVINKSVSIFIFTILAGGWTSSVNKAVFSTITTSQDPQITSETVRLLEAISKDAEATTLMSFCSELLSLPPIAYSHNLITTSDRILDHLYAKLGKTQDSTSHKFHTAPTQLCLRMLQMTLTSPQSELSSVADSRNVLKAMRYHLRRVASISLTMKERLSVYEQCMREVKSESSYATGSLDGIVTLAGENLEDLPWLVEQKLAEVATTSFCSFIEHQKGLRPSDGTLYAIDARFEAQTFLMNHGPSTLLDLGREQRLWSCLVGVDALDLHCRDRAWRNLTSMMTESIAAKPFLDRCIKDYLNTTPSSCFTRAAFGDDGCDFMHAVIDYEERVRPKPVSEPDECISVPFRDLLWTTMLTAPERGTSISASKILSAQYLESPAMTAAPLSAVACTHTDLIERCLAELKTAASQFNDVKDKQPRPSVPTTEEKNQQDRELRFERALTFLRQFVTSARTKTIFRIFPASATPSPELPHASKLGDNRIMFKYQIFNRGDESEIQDLVVDADATWETLQARLRKLTKFTSFQTILGGSSLDLLSDRSAPAQLLTQKGLLIISNTGEKVVLPQSKKRSSGISTAEQATLSHFAQLYGFLDFDDRLSRSVYSFLRDLPPHVEIRDRLTSETPNATGLFPCDKSYKCLYSLFAANECLEDQKRSGSVDDLFVRNVATTLIQSLAGIEDFACMVDSQQQCNMLTNMIETLLAFLKERSRAESAIALTFNEKDLVRSLVTILNTAKARSHLPLANLCQQTYETLIEVSLHRDSVWWEFIAGSDTVDIHFWLLVEHPEARLREAIRNRLQSITHETAWTGKVTPVQFRDFFWSTCCLLIPRAACHTAQSRGFFDLAAKMLSYVSLDESVLRSYLTDWSRLLLGHGDTWSSSAAQADESIFGLAQIMKVCVSCLKSLKKPLATEDLADRVFTRFLFPQTTLRSGASETPVVDPTTRSELYAVTLALCEDNTQILRLISLVSDACEKTAAHKMLGRGVNRLDLLRSASGYSGLRNLTNTCYMNSLMTQLYMNVDFRRFILQAHITDPSAQSLVFMTQQLFACMQDSNQKFADTEQFALAIRPYEGPHIDISVQMDVAEFYNLLFDRWESQLPQKADKDRLKSFYGGQFVQQIKSKDCDHVSERFEDFSTLSCEVKGKASLLESLLASVQGEVIEGDNKYKCEACGGRMVDAVKRSCLKDLPDTLIMDLKRFDYDLFQSVRSKIDDRFEFPETIDMSPYKIDHLNNPEEPCQPDFFDLIGVLVHFGFAEAGHYYSYVRRPSAADGYSNEWLEMNDVDVRPFDPANIPDACFGGPSTIDPNSAPKRHNAYMLFYQRQKSKSQESHAAPSDPVIPRATVPHPFEEQIHRQNEDLIRKYVISDQSHVSFILGLLSRAKNINNGNCTDDHHLEISAQAMLMAHLPTITRIKDLPDVEKVFKVLEQNTKCSECSAAVLHWLADNPHIFVDMLLESEYQTVRDGVQNLVTQLLKSLRAKDAAKYGADPAEFEVRGHDFDASENACLPRIVLTLRDAIPLVGRNFRRWIPFFTLLHEISMFGDYETSFLVVHSFFQDCLELLLFELEHEGSRHDENARFLTKAKTLPLWHCVIALMTRLYLRTNPSIECVTTMEDRSLAIQEHSNALCLNIVEEDYLSHTPGDGTNSFLAKVLEGWDVGVEPWCPGEIVRHFWTSDSRIRVREMLLTTVITSIQEYSPEFVGIPLRTGVVLIQLNPSTDIVRQLIATAASAASQPLRRGGSKDGAYHLPAAGAGGPAFIEFLETMINTDTEAASQDRDGSDQRRYCVLDQLPKLAPPLLLYDNDDVQSSMSRIIESLLLNDFPDVRKAGYAPTELDLHRCDVVRKIMDGCLRHFLPPSPRKFRALALPMRTTLQKCRNCLVRLSQTERAEMLVDRSIDAQLLDMFDTFLEAWIRSGVHNTAQNFGMLDHAAYSDISDDSERIVMY
ncbi:MAG: hypothetical protein M1828_004113 [Chrysothrix sp. TS-e1954]|nr:MAG: hypothetical protein M1828_004113 [Chrysothrix sp. TS-e1954]